jgi:hypothetical protein
MSSVEKEEKRISRRDFAKGAAVVGAGVLASCGPTPQVVKETVEVPVEVTKIVEVPAAAGPTGPVTLEVYNPRGSITVTQVAAPRVADLSGKTVCLVWSTGLWRGPDTFPVLGEVLTQRFPDVKVIPYTEFPIKGKDAATIAAVKATGCDAVIVGNGG